MMKWSHNITMHLKQSQSENDKYYIFPRRNHYFELWKIFKCCKLFQILKVSRMWFGPWVYAKNHMIFGITLGEQYIFILREDFII